MEPNEKEQSNAALFVKVGIVVLSLIMIVGFGIKFIPGAVTVSGTGSKFDLPIYCVNTDEQKVALSFDVALGNEDIKTILNILDKYNVKASFFMTGEWISKYPKDVEAIAEAGHDLGNHSESHKQMSQLTEEECIAEIMKVHKKIKDLTGKNMFLFRPPFGDYNNTLMEAARECDYYAIQWDVDSQDWKDYGVDGILKKTVASDKLSNGSIILMHSGTKYTAEALELVIVGLQDKGYKMVPVSKLIHTGQYTVDKTGRQYVK
jgi:polysaccharide deacetylase family sporulation protein PdaB